MSTLQAIYALSSGVPGFLIRNADTYAKWSHVGILTPQNTIIESRAFKGVTETPVENFLARYPQAGKTQRVDIECPDPEAALAWARLQLGKGYDYLAVFSLAIRESWQKDDCWHCAELLEAALVKGGAKRFKDTPWHISPNISYMV